MMIFQGEIESTQWQFNKYILEYSVPCLSGKESNPEFGEYTY